MVAKHAGHQINSYLRYAAESAGRTAPSPVDMEALRQRNIGPPLSYCLNGTPEDVAAQIRAYTAEAPVESVFLWASLDGMPEEMVTEHVQLICTRLAPLLADHRPGYQEECSGLPSA
jgi:alkanesulfonate monooxygenase SsuD/methylene tetrahydromethanopterin reductase-like flavin-dependent oxidoreductase (luciferase family)